MSKILGVVLAIVILAMIGGGVYVYLTFTDKINNQDNTIDTLQAGIDELKTNTQKDKDSDLLKSSFGKIYKNDDFDYQISYSSDWSITEGLVYKVSSSQVVKFLNADEVVITVETQSSDLKGIVKEALEIKTTKEAKIGGETGERIEAVENKGGEEKVYYMVEKGDYFYVIKAAVADAEILDSIIDTFKFIT